MDRAREYYRRLGQARSIQLFGSGAGSPGSDPVLSAFLSAMGVNNELNSSGPPIKDLRRQFDPALRLKSQFEQLCEFTQRLVRESESVRADFMKGADSTSLERWSEKTQAYRNILWDEVIGRLPPASLPIYPRSRKIYDEPRWTGYEVLLDVWPDVYAYGILLLPKALKQGERRPVVVCQHGLEGRPQDVTDPRIQGIYQSFAAQLADRGFITFAPQNPFIGKDQFRTLTAKAQPPQKIAFLGHCSSTSANSRMAGAPALRGPATDWLLWALLRR